MGMRGSLPVGRGAVLAAVGVLTLGTAGVHATGISTSTAATTATTAAPGDFGDLAAVCGPGTAAGATDQGVTDTQIVVGTASDPGAQITPGLNQELFDTATAFVGWCNDAGGILGRKLKLNLHDAKLFEAGPRMVEACQTDFMLVGSGLAFDDQAVKPREQCGMPQIAAYLTSVQASTSASAIVAAPLALHTTKMLYALRRLKAIDPAAASAWAQWNLNFPSVEVGGLKDRQAAMVDGFTEVLYDSLPSQVDNYRPYVEKLKEHGVQTLVMTGAPGPLAIALKTMNDVGYFPKYLVEQANMYDPRLIKEAGSALGKTTIYILSSGAPFELADRVPAVGQYQAILKQYAGAEPKALGLLAWSGWLVFARAAASCGDQLTRDCVMNAARQMKDFTSGGLTPASTPGNANDSGSPCALLMRATTTGFVYDEVATAPTDGLYNCDPANTATLP